MQRRPVDRSRSVFTPTAPGSDLNSDLVSADAHLISRHRLAGRVGEHVSRDDVERDAVSRTGYDRAIGQFIGPPIIATKSGMGLVALSVLVTLPLGVERVRASAM